LKIEISLKKKSIVQGQVKETCKILA